VLTWIKAPCRSYRQARFIDARDGVIVAANLVRDRAKPCSPTLQLRKDPSP
jgi:hypothetical protein